MYLAFSYTHNYFKVNKKIYRLLANTIFQAQLMSFTVITVHTLFHGVFLCQLVN